MVLDHDAPIILDLHGAAAHVALVHVLICRISP